ncbi:hypothetical protein DFS34DRAFT_591048 [Phlyctochytrium arcticum]|nr:hypothetical protein DFS34DRAFT_591048 [Phlyctochytrium arcticum]
MVTNETEQDPFVQLYDGLKKLRCQKNDLEIKLEEVHAKNIGLVIKNAELQAMLAAKSTEEQNYYDLEERMAKVQAQNATLEAKLTQEVQPNKIPTKQEEHAPRFAAKLRNLDCAAGFLIQIRRFIRAHPTRYPDDDSQIDLLVSSLHGKALNFVGGIMQFNIPELQSFANLVETINLVSDRSVEEGCLGSNNKKTNHQRNSP